jgi:hypothetical protein
MLQHGLRSAPPYLRLLKKKGFKEERVTTIELCDIGKSTILESNKSHVDMDGNNALYIKAIQVFISTFETLSQNETFLPF